MSGREQMGGGGEVDNVDGWVNEVACFSAADREKLEENIRPVRLVLVKVSPYFILLF